MKGKKTQIKKILRIFLIAILIFLIISFIITKIVYDFTFKRYNSENNFKSSFSDLAVEYEKVEFESRENTLCGYLFDNDKDALVIMTPGYRSSVSDYALQVEEFINFGWDVFIFDFTGHGESEGDSSVGFSQAVLDLDSALDYIEDNPNFDYSDVFLFGHSRGGFAACGVLGHGHDISAVCTVGASNSAMDGILEPSVKAVGPLAYGNYGFLWLYQSMLFGADTVNIEASEEIEKSDVPVLVVHGTGDETVSFEDFSVMSHREEILSDNTEYFICENEGQDGHTDLLFDGKSAVNEELFDYINDFYLKNQD